MARLLTALCGCALVLLGGCASRLPFERNFDLTSAEMQALDRPLECVGEVACAKLWRAAQSWVVLHAGYKIQAASDGLVQTFNPTKYSRTWAFTLIRSPKKSGAESIDLLPDCGEPPMCSGSAAQMVARFRIDLEATR